MGLLVTVAGVALVALTAIGIPSTLRIAGRSAFLAAVLIAGAADVVLVSEVLSPEHWLTRAGMLLALAVTAAATTLWWSRAGRPRPPRMAIDGGLTLGLHGATLLVVILAAVALLIQLYVGIRVAPSNWDSMTYHLSRAAYWLQYRSVGQFPGASIRQAASPPNAEIMLAWTMLMTGTDRWVETVQWIALIGLAATTFTAARLLGFSRSPSAFAAALLVVLPEPILQSVTTQTDLVTAFFVSAAAVFAVRGIRDRSLSDLIVAALAGALAVGTKGTALLVAPALLLLGLAAWRAYRPPRRLIAAGAGLTVAAIALLGSYNYVLNVVDRHDLLGGVENEVGVPPAGADRAQIAVQDLWTFADAPGVNAAWIENIVQRPARRLLGGIAGPGWHFTVRTTVQEDTTAFGLVGFLVLPVVVLWALLAPRGPTVRRVLAVAFLLALLVYTQSIDDPRWSGRLLVPSVAVGAPLLAIAARRPWVTGLVSATALICLVPCVLQNPQKPLLVTPGQQTVFDWSRIHQMTFTRPEMAGVLTAVQARIGTHAALAFAGGEDSWDYPLFGAHRQHRIERFTSPKEITYRLLRREHLAGALFANLGPPPRWLKSTTVGPDYYWVQAH